MTTFNAAILVTADASGARRELKATEGSLQALGPAARSAGTSASAGLRAIEVDVAALRRSSTGVTSNLVANFNDVDQMLAAGQSPLLLAAQQGTQISQALGQAGAAGSARLLGEAFVGMLAPTNLAVFAAVAGLGLMVNGLRGLIGETRSVEDAFGDLDAATKAWREAASVGVADLKQEFGTITPEILAMQRDLTNLRLTEMLLSAAAAASTLGQALNPGNFELNTRGGKIADLLGVEERSGVNQIANPQVEEFDRLLETQRSAVDAGEQIAALDRMQALILQSAGGLKQMNDEQRTFYGQTIQLERQLRLTQAAEEGIGSAQQIAQDRAARMLDTLRDEANIRRQVAIYGEESRQVAAARVEAERRVFEATLAGLDVSDQTKVSLREAWEAANGAQGSAADLAMSLLDAAGAGDDTRRAIADAWDILTGAADATNVWAIAMSGVAAEVRGIGAALASLGSAGIANASKEIELEALRSGKSVAEARRSVAEAEFRSEAELNKVRIGNRMAEAVLQEQLDGLELDRQLEGERKVASERDRAAARSGAGKSGGRQTEGADRLIRSLQRELDILRATDPVQKEMIRNREALAAATDAERLMVEELIKAKVRETEQQQQAQEAWDFSKNTAYDALDALIFQGEEASDVMANLAKAIGQALMQSALLGTGPLAGIFGGQGTGLFDVIGEWMGIPGAADGGFITGPGGPRDDQVLTWLSNGEYVVNAAATARHRPLLEAINGAPRFASGGVVGGGAMVQGRDGSAMPIVIDLRLTDDLDARIAERSRDVSVRVMRGGLEEYDTKVLPRRMRAINGDPRRVG